jgi:hypothetical protein
MISKGVSGAIALLGCVAFVALSVGVLRSETQPTTSKEILKRIDEMWRGGSSVGTVSMRIKTIHWERRLRMKIWAKGFDYTLIKIDYPKKEKGISTLRVQNKLWNYLPKVDRVIRIPSSLMMGNWMGSHFTNDDLVKQSVLAEDYHHRITFEGERDGEVILEITLLPKEEAAVVWGKIVITVRKKDLVPLEELFFDEDGKPVRRMAFEDIKMMGGRLLPARLTVVPENEPGELTEVLYEDIVFDVGIDEAFFSLRNLKKEGE